MDHPYRDWVRNKLADILGAGPTARNCERNILNWTVKTCSGAASFDKQHFRQMYKTKTMFLLASMKRCPEIIEKLKTKQLESSKIAFYSSDILEPNGPYSVALLANRTKDIDMEARKCKDEDYEGILTCGKCKSNKTDYYQMQTRSADEPMVRYSVFNTLFTILTPFPDYICKLQGLRSQVEVLMRISGWSIYRCLSVIDNFSFLSFVHCLRLFSTITSLFSDHIFLDISDNSFLVSEECLPPDPPSVKLYPFGEMVLYSRIRSISLSSSSF